MIEGGRNPWRHATPVAADFDFAAQQVIKHAPGLLAFRQCTSNALEDLSVRCAGLDRQLQKRQPQTIRRVAGKISIGFMTVVALLMQWPDHQLPMRFVVGFQAVGDLEVSHVWRELNETTEPRPFTEEERTDYLKSIAARPTDKFTRIYLGLVVG